MSTNTNRNSDTETTDTETTNTETTNTETTKTVPPVHLPDPSRTNALRAVGLILVLGLLTLSAASVVVQFFEQRKVVVSTVTTPVTRLVTNTDTGDIRVHVGEPGQPVRLVSTLHWSFHTPRSDWSTADGTLTVTGSCPGGFELGNCSVDLDLTVPPNTTVQLRTSTGDVRAWGLTAGLTATSSTGDVVLTAVGSQSVLARTSTGDVTITSTGTAPTVQAQTSTGDVSLTFNTAPTSVQASSSTGDVRVTVPADQSYAVQTDTSTGDPHTDVRVDPASTHRIEARTNTGDVWVLNR